MPAPDVYNTLHTRGRLVTDGGTELKVKVNPGARALPALPR